MDEVSLWWLAGIFVLVFLLTRLFARYSALAGFTKQVDAELDTILHHDECKVKGRFE